MNKYSIAIILFGAFIFILQTIRDNKEFLKEVYEKCREKFKKEEPEEKSKEKPEAQTVSAFTILSKAKRESEIEFDDLTKGHRKNINYTTISGFQCYRNKYEE